MSGDHDIFLGIDLGTTNSAAALFDGDRIDLVRNARGEVLTPSIVRIDARARVTVGAKARRFLESDPNNTVTEFKRLMGTGRMLRFPASGETRKPENLAAEILRSLLHDAREQSGLEHTEAVVAVPALFELPQASATSEAATQAGLRRVELIQEPVASALAAGWHASDCSGAWLVYDLGGGTFDVSLLQSRDGLLRVVAHDGDNFLGGRDMDNAVVDWALEVMSQQQARTLRRSDPQVAPLVATLKALAEEAKIELSRAERTELAIGPVELADGTTIEDELILSRAELERISIPIIDRTLRVCTRLLESQGVGEGDLERIVLVGGPTVMPSLRRSISEALRAPITEGLDPMTLVAQGAAIYAATAGLRPVRAARGTDGIQLLLDHPSMTSDIEPIIVGRVVDVSDVPRIDRLILCRSDGVRCSETKPDAEGVFCLPAKLLPKTASKFLIEAVDASGATVIVRPSSVSILHGMTLEDPPLSRSVGVALANDMVRTYVERGAPLPAKRQFSFETVESVLRGESESVLRIPIVQGEFEAAHLCRLVGALELCGDRLDATVPRASAIELTIEIDRGGKLSARAYVPCINQVFEHVESLLVPDATPDALEHGIEELERRLAALRTAAFRLSMPGLVARLASADDELRSIKRDADAAGGGDLDASQKAMRALSDLDAVLDSLEAERNFPELEAHATDWIALASAAVSSHGTDDERNLLDEAVAAIQRGREDRRVDEVQRQLRVVRRLHDAAYFRQPMAWGWEFERAASRVHEAVDLPRAQELVRRGREAAAKQDRSKLRQTTEMLWELLPAQSEANRRGHRSGVI